MPPTCLDISGLLRERLTKCEVQIRAKDERICCLETENAMLHLKLAQMRGSVNKLQEERYLVRSRNEQELDQRKVMRCTILALMQTTKLLRRELDELRVIVQNTPKMVSAECGKVLNEMEKYRHVFALQKTNISDLQQMLLDAEKNVHVANERHLVEKRRRKQLHNALVELRGNIRVHCRIRPLLDFDGGGQETAELGRPGTLSEVIVGPVDDENVCLRSSRGNRIFEYDRVFAPIEGQDSVFGEVQPLLTSLLDGYNVCIMAYGQTGSGKTHTMLGSHRNEMYTLSTEPCRDEGVIPRATRELFRLIGEKSEHDFSVEMSVVEVYNNDVQDLLSEDLTTKHEIVTGSDGAMCMPTVSIKPVHDVVGVMELVKHGLRTRRETTTLIHDHSSRSHLIVILSITLTLSSSAPPSPRTVQTSDGFLVPPSPSKERPRRLLPEPRLPNFGVSGSSIPVASLKSRSPSPSTMSLSGSNAVIKTKLQLVDLAGSECVGMSGVTGAALRETSNINKSLSALADVLGALAEHRQHVPYRNSKITHLLQDSIGGDAKLLVLLCVSPSQRYITETHQCLGFGQRARQVQRGPPKRKIQPGSERGHGEGVGRSSPRSKSNPATPTRPVPRVLHFD
ncbi:kinesin-like protein KIF25 [Lineus longissimus]|uniref:kinesin-like protein KIF25 n=1 Tax=Lineus longissimus TaxID=88925 RepID=UPI002B4FAF2B